MPKQQKPVRTNQPTNEELATLALNSTNDPVAQAFILDRAIRKGRGSR